VNAPVRWTGPLSALGADALRTLLCRGHVDSGERELRIQLAAGYRLADKYGIFVMAGWCCCDHWEHWANWKAQDFTIAEQSLRDQIYRLRGHPSLIAWLNGSDNPPVRS
jgi:exo-1,4-beta-D-glucosaminidase